MIAEDMDRMGTVAMRDAANAAYKVLSVLKKLFEYGEIWCEDASVIVPFAELVGLLNESEQEKARVDSAETELQRGIKQYMNYSHKVLKPIGKK